MGIVFESALGVPPDTVVWRYMRLNRFVELIQTRELHLTRLDQFSDGLEGRKTKPAFASAVEKTMRRYADLIPNSPISDYEWARPAAIQVEAADEDFVRSTIHVTCWHMADAQSPRMWREYGCSGVAIQTTAWRLFTATEGIYFQPVKYVDFDNDDFGEPLRFICKDQAYRHERELRGFSFYRFDTDQKDTPLEAVPRFVKVNCDLNVMVEAVHLAPESSASLAQVRRVLEEAGLAHVSVVLSPV